MFRKLIMHRLDREERRLGASIPRREVHGIESIPFPEFRAVSRSKPPSSRGGNQGRRQGAAGAVVAREKDLVARHDRRGDVRRAVGDLCIAPQQLAIRRPQPDTGIAREQHVLFDAADLGDNGGRVAGLVAFGLPNQLAVGLVQCHHAGARAAGTDDELFAVDQRRFADAPTDVAPFELPDDIGLPDRLPGCGFGAEQAPGAGERIDASTVNTSTRVA